MFASAGYFSELSCPYYLNGFCCRPHCQYRHASPAPNYKATPVERPVPQYKATPVSKLNKLKSTDKSSSSSSTLPQDTSAKSAKLIKHGSKVKRTKELSEDHDTIKAVKIEKNLSTRKITTDSLSNSSQSLCKKSTSTESPSITSKTAKPSSPNKSPRQHLLSPSSSSSNKSPKLMDSNFLEILDIPSVDSDCEEISVKKKARVAHKPASEIDPRKASHPIGPRMTAAQRMFDRFNTKVSPVVTSPKKPTDDDDDDDDDEPKSKRRIAHNFSPSIKKQSANPSLPKRRPLIPADFSNKVPLVVRTKYLNVIIDELLKFCPEDEAFSRGLEEEKSIHSKCSSKVVYMNLAANLVKRLRNEASAKEKAFERKAKFNDDLVTIANSKVSHQKILDGPHADNCSITKKAPTKTLEEITDIQFYKVLKRYVMTIDQLKEHGYPMPNPDNLDSAILPPCDIKKRNNFNSHRRICYRCMKEFNVDENGFPVTSEACVYHYGRLWTQRFNGSIERSYSCCKGDSTTGGCCSGSCHVVDGSCHPEFIKGYLTTRPPKTSDNFYGIYALDCEMCYTTVGLELTRITVIDHKLNLVYESLVKPDNPILDYNTKFSGITENDLYNVTTRLKDVHQKLLSFINDKTILVGHSLDSDFKALKLIHQTVIDTAAVFPHRRGLPYRRALRTLAAEFLQLIIQNDEAGHDSKEDAEACMKLMRWKLKGDLKIIKFL